MRVHHHPHRWSWLVGAIFFFSASGGVVTVAHGQGSKSQDKSEDSSQDDANSADAPDAKPRVIGNTVRAGSKVKREGDYGGVTPGNSPKQHRKLRKRKNAVSWIGFQARADGGARMFVRLANEVPYTQSVQGAVLTVHLEGARFRHRNTRRRLDVRFFKTAVQLITSKRVSRRRARKGKPARAAGMALSIRFKEVRYAQQANASVQTEKDGYTYLYLDFEPGPNSTDDGSGTIKLSDPEG